MLYTSHNMNLTIYVPKALYLQKGNPALIPIIDTPKVKVSIKNIIIIEMRQQFMKLDISFFSTDCVYVVERYLLEGGNAVHLRKCERICNHGQYCNGSTM